MNEKDNKPVVHKNSLPNSWTHTTNLDKMLEYAQIAVKSGVIPFTKAEDAVMVWQYGREIGLPVMQSLQELYPIPGAGGVKRVCAGVHIHEALILKSNQIQYHVIEDCVPVTTYKIKGGGTVHLSSEELIKGLSNDTYQLVTKNDFDDKGNLKESQKGKILLMKTVNPYLVAGNNVEIPNKRTTIRFVRPDKGIDEHVSYYLHEAARAGYLAKDNWQKQETAMLYTRCFTRGSKRYASDLLKGLTELSEMAQAYGYDYSYDEKGHVTVDVDHEEVPATDAKVSE